MSKLEIKTIGILGGGQLGRMMAQAAHDLGLKTHIYAPEADNPAYDVTRNHTIAAYEDEAALKTFASNVDIITYEFENVPSITAEILSNLKPLYPPANALKISQDRWLEKTCFTELNLKTPPFRDITNLNDFEKAAAELGRPSVLKTRRFGYDGKGQVKIYENTDLSKAYDEIKHQPAILEGFIDFEREISVILARNPQGEIKFYNICENEHKNHILHKTHIPANISIKTAEKAREIAQKIAEHLEYVGVLAVELFVKGEDLIVNEIAPRVHNSGHWTLGGAITSQFHQHIRAISGLPLGSPKAIGKIELLNLIGDDIHNNAFIYNDGLSFPVIYGKKESREGRKMGHITKILSSNIKND